MRLPEIFEFEHYADVVLLSVVSHEARLAFMHEAATDNAVRPRSDVVPWKVYEWRGRDYRVYPFDIWDLDDIELRRFHAYFCALIITASRHV